MNNGLKGNLTYIIRDPWGLGHNDVCELGQVKLYKTQTKYPKIMIFLSIVYNLITHLDNIKVHVMYMDMVCHLHVKVMCLYKIH